jgi:hypothetical protein
MTRSELLRDTLRRVQKEMQDWQELNAYDRLKAHTMGIRIEEDVERLIDKSGKLAAPSCSQGHIFFRPKSWERTAHS